MTCDVTMVAPCPAHRPDCPAAGSVAGLAETPCARSAQLGHVDHTGTCPDGCDFATVLDPDDPTRTASFGFKLNG